MSKTDLPASWACVPLSELLSGIEAGKSFKCEERPPVAAEVGVVKVSAVTWGEYREHESKTCTEATRINPVLFVRQGDFLFSRANTIDLVGACVIAGQISGRIMLSDKILRFHFFEDRQKSWVLQFLRSQSGRKQIELLSTGNQESMRNIGQERIRQIQIPVPPAREQTRIVDKLEELLSDLDAGVAELKAAQRKLAQYRQSLLKAAVEGALTADWRAARARSGEPQESGADLLQLILTQRRARWEARQLAKYAEHGKTPPNGWQSKYAEPTEPSQENHLALPPSWAWATVDQISIAQKYGSSSKTSEDASGIPVLRMGNIQDGRLDLTNLKYLPKDHQEFPDLLLEDGDLLFNRTNSPDLVGKTAVYRSEIKPCSYASYLIGVKLAPSCTPEFLSAFINSAYGRAWIKDVVTQQVGQANVNGSKLAALTVPLPPCDEQQEIVARLDDQLRASFHEQAMIERGLEQAAAQRKNILKAAFAGQLVPQDPHDEPASALLERIRAERVAQGATGRSKTGRQRKEMS